MKVAPGRDIMEKAGVNPTMLRTLVAIAFALVAPFACLWAVTHFEPALAATTGRGVLWINALIVAVFVLVLWTLSGRALLSLWLAYWMLWGLHALNHAKLGELERMLSPEDIAMMGQVVGHLDLFTDYVGADLASLLAMVGIVLATVLLHRFEPRTLPRLAWRVPMIVATSALAGSVLAGHGVWREQITDDRLGGFEVWAPDSSLRRSGLVAGLARLGWERTSGDVGLSSIERDALAAFVSTEREALDRLARRVAPGDPPDIVIVQSEALFDPGRLRGLDSADFLAEFHSLKERGLHGELRVPAYGGGTIRTEFEVLTGYPLAAFPHVHYPYYGLTDRPIPSALPAQLGRLGYRTLLVHPYEADFWNRNAAVRRLGIEEMQFQYDPSFDRAPRRGPYITDEATFEATLELLRADQPQFAFVITMENHSPWRNRRNISNAERDAIPVPAGLDPLARSAMQTYLMHLHHGDVALGRFADALLARERPTLLLVYGDHLPALKGIYEQIGFDDGRAAWEQPAPYLLVANFPIQAGRRDLHAHDLPSVVMEQSGLPLKGFLALSHRLRATSTNCEHASDCLLHLAARNDFQN